MSIKDILTDALKDFLEDQPHRTFCNECNKELEVYTEIDIDLDITAYVDPCPECCNKQGGYHDRISSEMGN